MSFREKSAWITVITLVVLSLFYITHLPQPWTLRPEPSGFMFHVLLIGVTSFVVIEIIAHIIIAVMSPKEARAPKDEREVLIGLKATRIGAWVYAVLSMTSVFMMHFGANVIGVGYLVLFSFVISTFVNYAMRIIYFRRGV